jgi:uncharacterized membrane protein
MLRGKRVTTIDHPNASNTFCNNISPDGEIVIVGSYFKTSPITQTGFRYQNGTFTDIPGPRGLTPSAASGINDNGDIVGGYVDGNVMHGFLLKGTTYTILDVPGAHGYTTASGINNHGKIVLYWADSSGVLESSVYDGKTYKTINVPGAADSQASDINNRGDVVYEWDLRGIFHGALLHRGKYYKFNFPQSVTTSGLGINDCHEIVGVYQATSHGPYEGFKAIFK